MVSDHPRSVGQVGSAAGLPLPATVADVAAAAAARGLVLPDACLAGVVANLALLEHHATIFLDGPTR